MAVAAENQAAAVERILEEGKRQQRIKKRLSKSSREITGDGKNAAVAEKKQWQRSGEGGAERRLAEEKRIK